MNINEEMTPLEQREIKGLSIKALITIIVCTASIVGTVLGTYYSLKSDMNQMKLMDASNERYNELKLKTLETKVETLSIQLKALENQVYQNSRQLVQ